jgi:hypothetical protein
LQLPIANCQLIRSDERLQPMPGLNKSAIGNLKSSMIQTLSRAFVNRGSPENFVWTVYYTVD